MAEARKQQGAILSKATAYEIRAELQEAIVKELLGPAGGPREIVTEAKVSDRYLLGLLAPRTAAREEMATEQQDSLAMADSGNSEEGSPESATAAFNSMFPSSLGLTFCVAGATKAILITASWGKYERETSQEVRNEQEERVWQRYPIEGQKKLTLSPGYIPQWVVDPEQAPAVYVELTFRRLVRQVDNIFDRENLRKKELSDVHEIS